MGRGSQRRHAKTEICVWQSFSPFRLISDSETLLRKRDLIMEFQSSAGERQRRNREHKNSRNGCLQCKARKVKVCFSTSTLIDREAAINLLQCDETKPKW